MNKTKTKKTEHFKGKKINPFNHRFFFSLILHTDFKILPRWNLSARLCDSTWMKDLDRKHLQGQKHASIKMYVCSFYKIRTWGNLTSSCKPWYLCQWLSFDKLNIIKSNYMFIKIIRIIFTWECHKFKTHER